MLFYRIEAKYEYIKPANEEEIEERRINLRRRRSDEEEKIESCFEGSCESMLKRTEAEDKALVFLAKVRNGKVTFGGIFSDICDVKSVVMDYVKDSPIEISDVEIEEITYDSVSSMMFNARNMDVLPDVEDVISIMDLDAHAYRNHMRAGDFVLDEIRSRDELVEAAKSILASETLIPEIDRIFCKAAVKAKGHPVHYFLMEDDLDCERELRHIVLEALYANNRIQNRRYTIAEIDSDDNHSQYQIDNLYERNFGGAVVIRYNNVEDEDGPFRRHSTDMAIRIAQSAINYKKDVLTIICLPTECTKAKNQFCENLANMTFVDLRTDVVFKDEARNYLAAKAKECNIKADRQLYAAINSEEGMHMADLKKTFNRWYDRKMKTVVYPQYSKTAEIKEVIKKEEAKGKAAEELDRMIGLNSAKEVIEKALNYYKLQKMYSDLGVEQDRPAMHMIFTGNPGTAKTTVARLFAGIMRDNGLLSKGDLYEVGRADLIGKYVGHTAPLVKEKFKAAKGSVLFIDEAYSLVDDRDGLYGDEAINTIVQEMENNRDNMVVIFAGYPDKMEGFMNKNPGLRSRIAFHVNFDDYTEDELCEIAELIAIKKGMRFSEDAMDKARDIFASARTNSDFGNGRYVRNMIEQAKMQQANRLVAMDVSKVTKEMVTTLEAEDIIQPKVSQKEVRRIGFAV